MKDIYNPIGVCFSGVGLTYGVANADELFGIILIVLNLIQLGITIFIEIRDIIKGKKSSTSELNTAIGSAVECVKDLVEEITEGDEENGNNTDE